MRRGEAIIALLASGVAGALMPSGDAAQAQQFSANLVSINAQGEVSATGKIYVANGKVRIETSDLPDSFLIVDAAFPAAYLVRPAQRIFMDSKQSSRLTEIFVPLDPADPCRRWQVMAEIGAVVALDARWRCEAIRHETVDGRDTIQYQALSPQHRQSTAWIDPQLNFLMRIRFEDGTVNDLKNIQEGPQPASLFEVPASYRKFDPLALIRRIKQSDVWVEPPH
jgi:hypothetical protein